MFTEVLNVTKNWYASYHVAIDECPVIVLIENYRSCLLWKLLMSWRDIKKGLKKLGFESPGRVGLNGQW